MKHLYFLFLFIFLLSCGKSKVEEFLEDYEQRTHKQDLERKKCLDEAKLKSNDPEKVVYFYKICLLERNIPEKKRM